MKLDSAGKIASLIDHAVLSPQAGRAELEKNCRIAAGYSVASVCVKPYMVADAREFLRDTGVMVGTVIGFPQGNSHIAVKVFEAETAIRSGAGEIDMVINIAKALEKDWDYLGEEIGQVVKATRTKGALLKVIFENGLLGSEDLIIQLCRICSKLDVGFVKTSTGFGYARGAGGALVTTGAKVEDIRLMRKHTSPHTGVKASGGIRSLDDVLRMHAAGANRIGTSSTEEIMKEALARYGE